METTQIRTKLRFPFPLEGKESNRNVGFAVEDRERLSQIRSRK